MKDVTPQPPKKRGGARKGAGRKPGTIGRRIQMLRNMSMSAIKNARKVPLEIMLKYMNAFDEEADSIREELLNARSLNTSRMTKAQKREHETKLIELWGHWRNCAKDAHAHAVDAAPFIHQKLSTTTLKVDTDPMKRSPIEDMTPEETNDYFLKLRLRPTTEVPLDLIIDNNTGEVVDALPATTEGDDE